MRIKIKISEDTYFIKLLYILYNIPPFNKLRPRELELYSNLLLINHKYRNIPFKERNKLIFSNDTNIDIAKKMGIKVHGVYTLLSCLRTAGVIEEKSLIPKYLLRKVEELTFVFEEDE